VSLQRPAKFSFLTIGAALALAVGLSGCVSLFPKAKPVQLYRFGAADQPAVAQTATVAVARTPTSFTRAAAGDRILTVTGQQTAYIADARWVAPAALLFDDAVERAFNRRAGGPRYLTRGDLPTANMALKLDVDTFEARYLDGPKAAPTVVVSMRATLVRTRDRAVMGEKVFTASKRADDNRVGAITEAFDAAVKDSVAAMADWTAATMGAGA
jgi:cholesterol transport system auxiliary component